MHHDPPFATLHRCQLRCTVAVFDFFQQVVRRQGTSHHVIGEHLGEHRLVFRLQQGIHVTAGSLPSASFVSANTVNGPGLPTSRPAPPLFRPVTSAVWSAESTAFSMMFFVGYIS